MSKQQQQLSEAAKDAIDEILNYFDFERVHKAMVALNWRWEEIEGVPSVGALVNKARSMLESVASGKYSSASTGGFRASIIDYPEGEECNLQLSFELDGWDASFPMNETDKGQPKKAHRKLNTYGHYVLMD